MPWVKLIPLMDSPFYESKDFREVFGSSFVSLLWVPRRVDSKYPIEWYFYTEDPIRLQRYFKVEEKEPPLDKDQYYVGIGQFRIHKDFLLYSYGMYYPVSAVLRAPEQTGLWIGVRDDPRLNVYVRSKCHEAREKELKARRAVYHSKSPDPFYVPTKDLHEVPEYLRLLEDKINEGVLLIDVLVVSHLKDSCKELCDVVKELSSPKNVTFKIKKVKRDKLLSWGPPKFGKTDWLKDLIDVTMFKVVRLHATPSILNGWLLRGLPHPKQHPIEYARGTGLPTVHLKYAQEKPLELGFTPTGETVTIDFEDLFRHAYVIGPTGTGKSTLLKYLAVELAKSGFPVVVLDPHGDLAEELYQIYHDSILLHPIEAPFGINPLDLPEAQTRESAVSIAVDNAVSLFTKVLHLTEQAVYVKFVLQTILRHVYSRIDNPSLGLLYKVIEAVYMGFDLPIDDERFRTSVKMLRRLPDQTFFSTFARLEPFANDKLVKQLTVKTTINLEKLLKPGKMILFAVPEYDVGERNAGLILATILLKLWYYVLSRARMRKERTPIFVIIDEFQTLQALPVVDTILSEARKFGLHLILAHQNVDQIEDKSLLSTVLSNTCLKFLFRLQGTRDLWFFEKVDATFAKEIAQTVTSLPVGRALLVKSAKPGEEQLPPVPVVLKTVREEEVERRPVTFTYDYAPPTLREIEEIENDMLASIISPILRYAKTPNVWKYYLVELIIKKGGEVQSGELAMLVPLHKDRFENLLRELSSDGWIEITIRRDRRYMRVSEEFYEQFYPTAPSDVGKKVAKAMVDYYAKNDYLVLPGKATNGPDAIAIPVIGRSFVYEKAVAVEIETFLGEHDHVNHTLSKKSSREIGRVHLWVPTDKLDVLKRALSENIDVELKILATDGKRVHELDDIEKVDEVLSKVRVEETIEEPMQEYASLIESNKKSQSTAVATEVASEAVETKVEGKPEEVPEDLKKCLLTLSDDSPSPKSENSQELREIAESAENVLKEVEGRSTETIEVLRMLRDKIDELIAKLERQSKIEQSPTSVRVEPPKPRSVDQNVVKVEAEPTVEERVEESEKMTEVRETPAEDATKPSETESTETTEESTTSSEERKEKDVIDEIVSNMSDEYKKKFEKLLRELNETVELERVKELILDYVYEWSKTKILPDRGVQGTYVTKTFAGEVSTVNLGSEEKMLDYLGLAINMLTIEDNVVEQIQKYGEELTLPDGRKVKVLSRVEPDNPPLNYALSTVLEEVKKILQRKEGLIDISNSTKFNKNIRVLSISTFAKSGYTAPRKISLYCLLLG